MDGQFNIIAAYEKGENTMLSFSTESVKGIKNSVKLGALSVTGTTQRDDGETAGKTVAVFDSALGTTYHIPLNVWIGLDDNAFDYGMSSALIDSLEGIFISYEPGEGEFIPTEDEKGLIDAGITPDAKEYWAGYSMISGK